MIGITSGSILLSVNLFIDDDDDFESLGCALRLILFAMFVVNWQEDAANTKGDVKLYARKNSLIKKSKYQGGYQGRYN